MMPLRVGLIGCGSMNSVHARTLAGMPEKARLVGFFDRHADRAAQLAAKYGGKDAAIETDHHALFAKAHLDAVVISLPPSAHTDEVDIAAGLGAHIFIEKPIAISREKAWHMTEACERAGIVTQVGFQLRFSPVVERLKALIDSGEAGPAGLITARYFCNSLHAHWWRVKDQSGGQVYEQATHLLDLMRHFAGEAESIFSIQRNLFHQEVPDYTVEDVSGTLLNFRSGAIGVLAASNNAIPGKWEWDLRLVTRNLTAYLPDPNHAEIVFTTGAEPRREEIASDRNLYAAEMDDFLTAVANHTQARIPMREGALTLELGAAAARSASTRMEQPI